MNITTKQWALILASGVGLAVLNVLFFNLLLITIICGASNGIAIGSIAGSIETNKRTKAIEAAKIDGRTHQEWYDLIRVMSREEYERLSRPALDGLEDNADGIGGWDVETLVGRANFLKLRMQWYPEKHCHYCKAFTDGIPGNCMWDGPCHDFQYWYQIEQKKKAIKALQMDRRVIMETPKARVTPADLKKELEDIKTEMIKWDQDFVRLRPKTNEKTFYWDGERWSNF